jgi:hypothetical protein
VRRSTKAEVEITLDDRQAGTYVLVRVNGEHVISFMSDSVSADAAVRDAWEQPLVDETIIRVLRTGVREA